MGVDAWAGEVKTIKAGEKLCLQLAAGDSFARVTVCQDRAQLRDARSAWVAVGEISEGERAHETSDTGFVDGLVQLRTVKHRRQVEQCAGGRGYGDAVLAGELVQGRPRPTRKGRGHPPPLPRENSVGNRVDTAMEAVKPALLNPVADGTTTNSALNQLLAAHHAVLNLSQAPDQPIELPGVQLSPIVGLNVTMRVHTAILATYYMRGTARTSRISYESAC